MHTAIVAAAAVAVAVQNNGCVCTPFFLRTFKIDDS